MISDTLFDAVADIERYQNTFPGVYDAVAPELAQLVAAMNALRKKLDAAPTETLQTIAKTLTGSIATLAAT